MSSIKGEFYFVKPGKAFSWDKHDKSWRRVKTIGNLNNKIDRVVTSPCGETALHLPKAAPVLAFHRNTADAFVTTLPLPKGMGAGKAVGPSSMNAPLPSGESALFTKPQSSTTGEILSKKCADAFSQHVKGFACSEDGRAIAIAYDQQFWVWQQYPEEVMGIGVWTDLTADQRFVINARSNHPDTQVGKLSHGFHRFRQSFTLHPILAPNVPQNAAVSYQDLCMFNNPDEGIGVCCLTALLPPCKPFDTLYLFISVCTFNGTTPVFQRADVTLPIVEGYGAPCIWWSVDCRFAVIAVSQSLVIVTRYLRIIEIIPLTKIFPGDEPIVASVAWSCIGEYFVVTSTQGDVSAVSRSGKSMKHCICHLTSFSAKSKLPLMAAADAKDPNLFLIYSQKEMRPLRIDPSMVLTNFQILMSLQFPQRSVADKYDRALTSVIEHGIGDPQKLVTLLYYTDLYRIFPYASPLRYKLLALFNEGARLVLDSGNDIFAFFIARCIYRLTGSEVSIYSEIMNRLSWSENKRDKILLKILEDELNKLDHVPRKLKADSRIVMYNMTEDDTEDLHAREPPPHCRSVKLEPLIKLIKSAVWDPEFDPDTLIDVDCDLHPLMDFLIQLGLFDRVIILSKHASIAMDPLSVFLRICGIHSNDAAMLYRAMVTCIAAAQEDEMEIRAACVRSITNILKQRISDSMPTAENPSIKMMSEMAPLEEKGFLLATPEHTKELDDFAVILSIGLCAADFPACANFVNRRQNLTPDGLRESVRGLFAMLWFVKWRYLAICETARLSRANDATLRLLAFPEFVDRKAARSQVAAVDQNNFSQDLMSLYVDGNCMFEKDPEFGEFAVECSAGIKPRGLARIHAAVMRFGTDENREIPRSNILLASFASHIIPWLRCGIPRALAGFDCGEEIPRELLDLEEFSLPTKLPMRMELVKTRGDLDDWEPVDNVSPVIDAKTPVLESISESDADRSRESSSRSSTNTITSSAYSSTYSSTVSSERSSRRVKRRKSDTRGGKPAGKKVQPTLRLLTVDPVGVAPPNAGQYGVHGPYAGGFGPGTAGQNGPAGTANNGMFGGQGGFGPGGNMFGGGPGLFSGMNAPGGKGMFNGGSGVQGGPAGQNGVFGGMNGPNGNGAFGGAPGQHGVFGGMNGPNGNGAFGGAPGQHGMYDAPGGNAGMFGGGFGQNGAGGPGMFGGVENGMFGPGNDMHGGQGAGMYDSRGYSTPYDAPIIHTAMQYPSSTFAPIWDFNPALFEKPVQDKDTSIPESGKRAPSPPKREAKPKRYEDRPVNTAAQTQNQEKAPPPVQQQQQSPPPPQQPQQQCPPTKPMIVFASRQTNKKLDDSLDFSMSSELSELSLQEPIRKPIPTPNPFPIDDGLHRKIEQLLDEVKAAPDAPELPERPVFTPPPVYEIPVVSKQPEELTPMTSQPFGGDQMKQTFPSYHPTEERNTGVLYQEQAVFTPKISMRSAFAQPEEPVQQQEATAGVPNWRPTVVSIRDSRIIGIQPISLDEFRTQRASGGMPVKSRVQLQEIQVNPLDSD